MLVAELIVQLATTSVSPLSFTLARAMLYCSPRGSVTSKWLTDCSREVTILPPPQVNMDHTASLSLAPRSLENCTALHCTALHCTALFFTALCQKGQKSAKKTSAKKCQKEEFIVSVLLSAHIQRVSVSRIWDLNKINVNTEERLCK